MALARLAVYLLLAAAALIWLDFGLAVIGAAILGLLFAVEVHNALVRGKLMMAMQAARRGRGAGGAARSRGHGLTLQSVWVGLIHDTAAFPTAPRPGEGFGDDGWSQGKARLESGEPGVGDGSGGGTGEVAKETTELQKMVRPDTLKIR